MPVKRSRKATVLCKAEAVEGTLESLAGTDGIEVEAPTINFNPDIIFTDEVADSLDPNTPLVGGMTAQLSWTQYVKGNDNPGELPDWDDMLRACGMARTQNKTQLSGTTFALSNATTLTDSGSGLAVLTVGTVFHIASASGQKGLCIATSAAAGSTSFTRLDNGTTFVAEIAGGTWTIRYFLAGTAATAGTTTTATMQAPFAATANLYRGLPWWLSGNPATPELVFASDYTAARIATFDKLFGSALSASTRASIPPHILYQPSSSSIPSASVAMYMDGVLWSFLGCRGNCVLSMEAGRPWRLQTTMYGLLAANPSDAAAPSLTIDGTRPGVWKLGSNAIAASKFQINRVLAGLQQAALDFGNRLEYPMNPNMSEARDPAVIVSRQHRLTANPYLTDVATRALLADMRVGTPRLMSARLAGGQAQTPGNGAGLVMPAATLTAANPGNNAGFVAENIEAFPAGRDAGFMLSVF